MYGMVHRAARELAILRHGESKWNAIAETAGVSEREFISAEVFTDAVTISIVSAVADADGSPIDRTLLELGRHWIDFAGRSAYSNVMSMAGDTLPDFCRNLDRMHTSIQATMPDAIMPSFEVEAQDEAGLTLIYRSQRTGLETFVQGLLEGLMERFKVEGTVARVDDSHPIRFRLTYKSA
ncbi:MAG: heme NO-binding domain-containing protein [Alphaproteobacteria bacterium]|nr:heme NO-binding domain-containing protein [Alphaproteobacteria bacterium]